MIKMKSKMWLDMNGVLAAVKEAQVAPIQKAAALVEATMKQKVSKGGREKRYEWGHKRRTGEQGRKRRRKVFVSVASKAGEPPRAQTGVLMNSISSAMTSQSTAVVGPKSPPAHYGAYLEYGTRNMEPRPFARVSLLETKDRFPQLWRNLMLANTVAGRALNRRKS